MDLSKKLIYENYDRHNWLAELLRLTEQLELQKEICTTTSTECCKSILESITKNIVKMLDQAKTEKQINDADLGTLISWSKKVLLEHDVVKELLPKEELELVFSSINQWLRFLGQVRNKLGEVSHGKIFPRPYSLDNKVSKFIIHNTDGFAHFLIDLVIRIDQNLQKYIYESFEDFNDYLDELNPLEGKILYSKALYDQDYDAYSEELDNYLDSQNTASD